MAYVTRILVVAIAALLLFARSARAEDAPTVSVYTIGTGDYLFAKFGHTAACVTAAGAAEGSGRCYDFGVSDPPDDLVAMAWGAFRGEANFAVVGVDEKVLIETFSAQGRSVERQRLRLPPAQAKKLAGALEHKLATRAHYAYHPQTSNCTTYVRDLIDEATDGTLRASEAATHGPTFREIFEAGVSGEILPLTAMALWLGPAERRPTTWELQFLPIHLRDALKTQLRADVEVVRSVGGFRLPTSRHVGRATVVVLGIGLALMLALSRYRGTEARAIRTVTGLLAALGVVTWGVAGLCAYAEFRFTWSLLVFLPVDVLLFRLPWGRRQRYLEARLVTCTLLAALSLIGVVHQPVWAPALFAGLPLAYLWLAPRLPKRRPKARPAAKRPAPPRPARAR